MAIDKSLLAGSTGMLLLKLLEDNDMYGYQMIEELAKKSDDTFALKAGTLYPLLHNLEKRGWVTSYEAPTEGKRVRKYYSLTEHGRGVLAEKTAEWQLYAKAVNRVMDGGVNLAIC